MNQTRCRVSATRNVSRAIARSRAVRASVARRRKRIALIAACLGMTAGLPVAWILAEPATAIAASAAEQVRDLADLLNQRSPGARTQAELTKRARAAAKERQAGHPALAGREASAKIPITRDIVDLLMPQPEPIAILAAGASPPFAPPTTLAGIFASTPNDQSFTPPGGGGGGVGGGGGEGGGTVRLPTSEPKEIIPPSAVPEPATWVMMLTGFALIGWRVRRRPAAGTARRDAS